MQHLQSLMIPSMVFVKQIILLEIYNLKGHRQFKVDVQEEDIAYKTHLIQTYKNLIGFVKKYGYFPSIKATFI